MAAIKEHLSRVSTSYTLRNDLAHGHWWKFDSRNKSVLVRRDRSNNERSVEVTVARKSSERLVSSKTSKSSCSRSGVR